MKNGIFFSLSIFLITSFFCLFNNTAFAASDYVLPYPSLMPGSKLYGLQIIWEKISKFWYFGNLAQFTYNLKQSDKYLVEAKTLFEYNQYLLAVKALGESDNYFEGIKQSLLQAKLEGKDIKEKEKLLMSASTKHKEVLLNIQKNSPATFLWKPEKTKPTPLNLKKIINNSIEIRRIFI